MRKSYSADFKAKVALAAIKEDLTMGDPNSLTDFWSLWWQEKVHENKS